MGSPPIKPADAMRTLSAIRDLVQEVPAETGPWPELLFKHRGVQPPSALYVTQDDFLRVSIFTTASTTSLVLGLRIMGADGQVRREEESLDGVSLSTLTTKTFGLREGFLLGVAVSNLGGGLADGVCFVSVGLQFGSGSRAPYQILAQDYVTNLFSVEWPAAAVRHGSSAALGTGSALSQQVSNPAAGAEWTFTVPAATTYTLKSVFYQLVTSSAAATRISLLKITDGTNTLFQGDVSVSQTASLTKKYAGGSGITDPLGASSNFPVVALPVDMVLGPGWKVGTATTAIDLGDQYSAISLGLIQWS
jgi:hypothetical protein